MIKCDLFLEYKVGSTHKNHQIYYTSIIEWKIRLPRQLIAKSIWYTVTAFHSKTSQKNWKETGTMST